MTGISRKNLKKRVKINKEYEVFSKKDSNILKYINENKVPIFNFFVIRVID